MISGPALPCPKCRGKLEPISWHGAGLGRCRRCDVDFEFRGFPALNATKARPAPKASLAAEHATCFFHAENQAEAVCDSCGRFLCAVCAVDFGGRRLCPGCIATAHAGPIKDVGRRTLYEGIALSLAGIPLLIFPFTLFTAPIALGVVIVGWRKPRSLVGGGPAKLIIAGTLALLELAGWAIYFIFVAE